MYGQRGAYAFETKAGKEAKAVVGEGIVHVGIGSEEMTSSIKGIFAVARRNLELRAVASFGSHGGIEHVVFCTFSQNDTTTGGNRRERRFLTFQCVEEDGISSFCRLGGQETFAGLVVIIHISFGMNLRSEVLHIVVASCRNVEKIAIFRKVEGEYLQEVFRRLESGLLILNFFRRVLCALQQFERSLYSFVSSFRIQT